MHSRFAGTKILTILLSKPSALKVQSGENTALSQLCGSWPVKDLNLFASFGLKSLIRIQITISDPDPDPSLDFTENCDKELNKVKKIGTLAFG